MTRIDFHPRSYFNIPPEVRVRRDRLAAAANSGQIVGRKIFLLGIVTLSLYKACEDSLHVSIPGAFFGGLILSIIGADIFGTSIALGLISNASDGDLTEATLLYRAAQKGDLLAVKTLLTFGANPNAIGEKQHLPALYAAIESGDQAIITAVVKSGAIVTLPLERLYASSSYPREAIAFAAQELSKRRK